MIISKYIVSVAVLSGLVMSAWADSDPIKLQAMVNQIQKNTPNVMSSSNYHRPKFTTKYHRVKADTATSRFYRGETPASLACIYGLTPYSPGCNPATATAVPQGGWGVIALVGAFHSPTAENDLNVFSRQFGLPECTKANGCFRQIYASGKRPVYDSGWAGEMAMDIEWAHAMAPKARIILVEADDSEDAGLLQAVQVASEYVHQHGGGMVSMSWASMEDPDRVQGFDVMLDAVFKSYPDIIYVAGSGDSGGSPAYPGTSPYVVSAGGSNVVRDAKGNFVTEQAWDDTYANNFINGWSSDGGVSLYQNRPSYQNLVQKVVGGKRGVPDVSFCSSSSNGGAYVYDSSSGSGWYLAGGTSLAAPALAGIINVATAGHAMSSKQLLKIAYNNYAKRYTKCWREISVGYNGYYAMRGYNLVTGIGTPITYDAFRKAK